MKKASFTLYLTQLLFIMLLSMHTAYAQTPTHTMQAEKSTWAKGNYLTINTSWSLSDKLNMTIALHNQNNSSVEFEGVQTGSLKLLNGQVIITKGINNTDQFMIDTLDSAALFSQLAISLLEIAAPEGPELKTAKQVNLKEKDRVIVGGTMSARMDIPPP